MAMLSCPRCDAKLDILTVEEVEVAHLLDCGAVVFEIEVCSSCRGVFLDSGELNKYSDVMGDEEFCTAKDKQLDTDDGQLVIHCPKCKSAPTMRKVEFLSHTDIVLDHCDQCKSFWLDHGELEQINNTLREIRDAGVPWMLRLHLIVARLPFI
jgi:Zn-finger nucleic acid-binding protein